MEQFNIRPEHAHHTNAKGAENQGTSIEGMTKMYANSLDSLRCDKPCPFRSPSRAPGLSIAHGDLKLLDRCHGLSPRHTEIEQIAPMHKLPRPRKERTPAVRGDT